jgi:ribonuclease BN (tRNA processing enzyme)
LAREARVKRLEVFHFSPRYEGEAESLFREAEEAYRGESEPYVVGIQCAEEATDDD